MGFFESFQKEPVSLGVSLLTSLILWFFRARPILVYGQARDFTFLVKPPKQGNTVQPSFTVQTVSHRFANAGRVTATNIEVTFNFQPDNYQVWPVRSYDVVNNPDGRVTLRFNNLAPKQECQIDILSVQMPILLNVRCAEAVGRQVLLRTTRFVPRWLQRIIWVLIFLGLAATVYIALRVGAYVLEGFLARPKP